MNKIRTQSQDEPRVVTPEDSLFLNAPEMKFEHVRLEGGQIITSIENTSFFHKLENQSATPLTIEDQVIGDVLVLGNSGRDGADGYSHGPADDGRDGRNCSCNWASGCDDCHGGEPGNSGEDGQRGEDGQPGDQAFPATFEVTKLIGDLIVFSAGGNGGDGGNGGNGGKGGNGGNGGRGASDGAFTCNPCIAGNGGNGGDGGDGGNGGRGGDGTQVTIRYKPKNGESVTGNSAQSEAGARGIHGTGAEGGSGGINPGEHGADGADGADGHPGERPGTTSSFHIFAS